MKLFEKMKRFYLKKQSNGGFTLVELIVVIAILAILAGIAVPAYSGYVEKAERAADEQLLANVNQAFAAACAINGENNYFRTDIDGTLTDGEFDLVAPSTIDISFNGFYEGGKFKVFTSLAYDNSQGIFINGVCVRYGEYKFAISQELANAMQNNTFSNLLGAGVLTDRVDTMSTITKALLEADPDAAGNYNTFYRLVFDEEGAYLANLQATLGLSEQEMETFFMNGDGSWKTNVLANSLVLTAAQKTQGIDTSFLGTPGTAAQLRADLDKTDKATDAMAKLALTYGMYSSYMKSQGLEDASQELLDDQTFTGMTEVLGTIEGEKKPEGAKITFNEYLKSSQGQADLNAYMASMQIINDSSNQSIDATKEILNNGFTDPDLVGALNGLFGYNN